MVNKIIIGMIYGYPASELLNGFIFGYDSSKLITNIYVIILCWLIVIYLCMRKPYIEKSILYFIISASSIIFLSMAGGILNGYNIKYDISLYLRSIIFGSIVYIYIQSIEKNIKLIKNFSIIWWTIITFSILISYYFDIGMYTYEKFQSGRKFYFTSNNELTIFYSSLSIFLILNQDKILRYTVLIISILIFLLIGVKSFIISYLLIIFFFLLFYSYRSIGIYGTSVYITICALLLFFSNKYFYSIIEYMLIFYSKYSLGGEKLMHKLSYLSQTTALLGERDIIIQMAVDSIRSFNIYNVFFGFSYSGYGSEFGQYMSSVFRFAENDLLDITFSYGIAGISIYIILVIVVIKNLCKNSINRGTYYSCSISALNVLILGAVGGHGIFFSLPMLVFILMHSGGDQKSIGFDKKINSPKKQAVQTQIYSSSGSTLLIQTQ